MKIGFLNRLRVAQDREIFTAHIAAENQSLALAVIVYIQRHRSRSQHMARIPVSDFQPGYGVERPVILDRLEQG
jgi:hypothetical protein